MTHLASYKTIQHCNIRQTEPDNRYAKFLTCIFAICFGTGALSRESHRIVNNEVQ